MSKILCFLRFHKWHYRISYISSNFYDKHITYELIKEKCLRCNKEGQTYVDTN